eukprot:4931405-Pyramimonas_sp.AAC.1
MVPLLGDARHVAVPEGAPRKPRGRLSAWPCPAPWRPSPLVSSSLYWSSSRAPSAACLRASPWPRLC